MNNCNFKVGQTVWCLIYGEGTIVDVGDNPHDTPVLVHFNSGYVNGYTLDGYMGVGVNRALFFSEPKIEAQEFPSKYAGKTVFLVDPCGSHGPFKITKEDADYIYTQGPRFYKEDYHIYIVEQDEE